MLCRALPIRYIRFANGSNGWNAVQCGALIAGVICITSDSSAMLLINLIDTANQGDTKIHASHERFG